MRTVVLSMLFALLISGCSQSMPVFPSDDQSELTKNAENIGQYLLWGEWTFYIDESHENVSVVPKRSGNLHLNVTKIMETYCTDCIKITKIKKNGDSTIDLTVRLKHPFPNVPEYTGFDVKGIIMFRGSHEMLWTHPGIFPKFNPLRTSWRKMGDPQVLNADGFTPRWCPEWQSDSELPIFNYWPGKYSHGTPTANINAFMNFYTDEERHMFRVDGTVERTYHIWLPPGQITAGYAVEAHWDAPTVTPVTNPLTDFPITANQWDAYKFKYVINNGEPVTEHPCCGDWGTCPNGWIEVRWWQGARPNGFRGSFEYAPTKLGTNIVVQYGCPVDEPPYDDEHFIPSYPSFLISGFYPNGEHQGAGIIMRYKDEYPVLKPIAWDVYEFVVNLPE